MSAEPIHDVRKTRSMLAARRWMVVRVIVAMVTTVTPVGVVHAQRLAPGAFHKDATAQPTTIRLVDERAHRSIWPFLLVGAVAGGYIGAELAIRELEGKDAIAGEVGVTISAVLGVVGGAALGWIAYEIANRH
jgi:hypothetical protein